MIKLIQGDNSMRGYDYTNKWERLLSPEIVSMLTAIHEVGCQPHLYSL